jgi:hypothetical protein
MIFPPNSDEIQRIEDFLPLIHRCLELKTIVHPEGTAENEPPIAIPLWLDADVVGVLLIITLVAHHPRLERLQRDLLSIVSRQFARAVNIGSLIDSLNDSKNLWGNLQLTFPGLG